MNLTYLTFLTFLTWHPPRFTSLASHIPLGMCERCEREDVCEVLDGDSK